MKSIKHSVVNLKQRYRKLAPGNKIAFWSLLCTICTGVVYPFFPTGQNKSSTQVDRSPATVSKSTVDSPDSVQQTMMNSHGSVQIGTLNVNQTPPQRLLSVAAANRIMNKLRLAKPVAIRIEALDQGEPGRLALQIRNMFQESGFTGVDMILVTGDNSPGVRVLTSTKLDASLEDALRLLFKEIGQEAIFTSRTRLKGTGLGADFDVKIRVGHAFEL